MKFVVLSLNRLKLYPCQEAQNCNLVDYFDGAPRTTNRNDGGHRAASARARGQPTARLVVWGPGPGGRGRRRRRRGRVKKGLRSPTRAPPSGAADGRRLELRETERLGDFHK